jgi:hypothetical protein
MHDDHLLTTAAKPGSAWRIEQGGSQHAETIGNQQVIDGRSVELALGRACASASRDASPFSEHSEMRAVLAVAVQGHDVLPAGLVGVFLFPGTGVFAAAAAEAVAIGLAGGQADRRLRHSGQARVTMTWIARLVGRHEREVVLEALGRHAPLNEHFVGVAERGGDAGDAARVGQHGNFLGRQPHRRLRRGRDTAPIRTAPLATSPTTVTTALTDAAGDAPARRSVVHLVGHRLDVDRGRRAAGISDLAEQRPNRVLIHGRVPFR